MSTIWLLWMVTITVPFRLLFITPAAGLSYILAPSAEPLAYHGQVVDPSHWVRQRSFRRARCLPAAFCAPWLWWRGYWMLQHAGTDVQNTENRQLATLPRRSRTPSHEQIHYKRKNIEQHRYLHRTQCNEEGHWSAQTNQACVNCVSNLTHIPLKAYNKNSKSISQCLQLNASITRWKWHWLTQMFDQTVQTILSSLLKCRLSSYVQTSLMGANVLKYTRDTTIILVPPVYYQSLLEGQSRHQLEFKHLTHIWELGPMNTKE